jgi:FtsP/CotA-like multicopper oxidase with cupredoxin domain
MTTRRDMLKYGLGGAGYGLLAPKVSMGQLIFPDGFKPSIAESPSPPVTPYKDPLNVIPIAQPVNPATLNPPPDPERHQRYNEFPPQKFYVENIGEFLWQYHSDPPYDQGTWSWGFNGITPGPTYHARYDEPVFVRRNNVLPPIGTGMAVFPLPSVTIHLHNAHTASESDGIPQDYFNPGEFWDHHYANFPAGFDPREIMTTLWYHDHRLDFTATNVYAGLSGFYLLFDELDANDETDINTFQLPSGPYDVPLILHDVQFDQNGQVVWDFFTPSPDQDDLPSALYTVNGMIGDRYTVNRIIQPHFQVERRKYRFRILNGGPSRFYSLFLTDGTPGTRIPFTVLSTDGNLLPKPIELDVIPTFGVAQRHDIIIDFSTYQDGDFLYLGNLLEMRDDGAGWTGREVEPHIDEMILRFDVVGGVVDDPSRIPKAMRELPAINFDEVRRERLFVFDYDNGLWTVNGQLMDPNRADALIEQGSAEIWTFRNAGSQWMHPIHTHFEEFQIVEWNGKPIPKGHRLKSRKDVLSLGPNDEVRFFSRWRDFLGKHVMHCHNVVHEDHAMMIRWDIVPPGEGD